MYDPKPNQTPNRPSETERRRGKDFPPNRNNRTTEDQPFFVPSDGSAPERYRF